MSKQSLFQDSQEDWRDWYDAAREHGRSFSAATRLANECAKWQANNPGMRWQDIWDAALLEDETQESVWDTHE
jgi:hypothetical protein